MNYLKQNLKILKTVNPALVELIEKSECPAQISVYEKPGKILNLTINRANQNLLVYNENDKMKAFEDSLSKDFNLDSDTASVILGIGAGHMLKVALKRKNKKHVLIVAEPIPYLLKLLLEKNDLTEEIKNGEVLFASPTNDEILVVITMVDQSYVINVWNMIVDPIALKWPEKYGPVLKYTSDIINQIQCNTGTVIGAGNIFAENDIRTFASCFRHRGINELKGLYKNKPAILVSTSPSLSKNIHLLTDKKYRDNYIIFAIAQSLRVLLAYGIVPDFITTVDYGVVNIEHFQGLWDCQVPLIALNKTYAPIIQKWKGTKFIVGSGSTNFPNTVSNMIAEKGSVDQGGSVTHMNFGAAVALGCNPITTIGLDLGYEDNLSHNPNADASGTVKVENGQLLWDVDSPDSSLKGDTHSLGEMQLVEGFWGVPIKTGVGLLSFKTSFEALYRYYKGQVKIYNSTEGGSHIKGSIRIQLKDFIEQFCTKQIDKSVLNKYLNTDKEKEPKLIEQALDCLNNEIKIFNDIKENAREAIKYGKKMVTHYNKHKDKLKKYMDENYKYSTAAEKLAKNNPTLTMAIFYAQREIFNKEMNVNGEAKHLIENKKDLEIRVKRNKYILEAATKACNTLIPWYEEEKNKIEKYRLTGDDSIFIVDRPDPIPTMVDYEAWIEKKNFAFPILSLQNKNRTAAEQTIYIKALELKQEAIEEASKRPDRKNDILYLEYIDEAFELGKDKKYKEALKPLKKAYKLKTTHNNERALWGLATTFFILKDMKKSDELFSQLVKDNPDNLRYEFEYGCSLLHRDMNKGMDIINEVFSKTKQFDFFYKTVGDLLHKNGKTEEALKAYKYYIELFPDDILVKEKIKKLKK